MSERRAKHKVMSSEPPVKKQRVELSNPTEPLTQRDVITFQKEALFRSLNQYRTQYDTTVKQYQVVTRSNEGLRKVVSSLYGVLTSLSNKLSTVCSQDERELFDKVIQIDATQTSDEEIVHLSDGIIELLDKHISGGETSNPTLINELKRLESLKTEYHIHNKQLSEELSEIKKYYQELLHKYDREDSLSVKRVFKDKENQEVKEERKETPPTESTVSNNENGNLAQVEHDLEVSELKANIEALQATIKELETWKSSNEQELINLRTELVTKQTTTPQVEDPDRDVLLSKIQLITRENSELSRINDSYLAKFQQLSQEREIFTNKLSTEFQTAQETLKKHNSTLEKDLVRIRTTRDELLSKIAVLESQRAKSEMLTDLKRVLDLQTEQINKLSSRCDSNDQDALMKELQDLEKAFKELSSLSHKKYSEYMNHESIISKLTVEKTKADQKYFAAMRSKDSILIENKNLSKNLSKSNELILQLKDLEKTLQLKIENLGKQMQLSQNNEKRLIESNKSTSLKIMELTSQVNKSKKLLNSLESNNKKLTTEKTELESKLNDSSIELKTMKVRVAHAETKAKKLHKSLISNGGDAGVIAEELENFRTVVYCSLCSKNWKNTAIKSCGHVFCEECCKERLAARMRKCPTCNKGFSANDLLVVHL